MQRILTSAHAEQTINKSRFIAAVDYCENERAVAAALRKLASQHQGASHLAYAFRLKTEQGIVQRFSDAGEPPGTAGKPILQFLEGRDLINVCVGVIRYYGGINLGTGGLARAYGGTAKIALEAARTGPYVEMRQYRLQLSYNKLDQFVRELQQRHGEVRDKQFGEYVQLEISLPLSEEEWLIGRYGTP